MDVRITQEGNGAVPQKGQTIAVHYTGKLTDGTVFDSSVPKGRPLRFSVGAGQVIRGWDEGFLAMKVGSKAVLTCPPDYAYGAGGIPGVIPPNATLVFEVELLAVE